MGKLEFKITRIKVERRIDGKTEIDAVCVNRDTLESYRIVVPSNYRNDREYIYKRLEEIFENMQIENSIQLGEILSKEIE